MWVNGSVRTIIGESSFAFACTPFLVYRAYTEDVGYSNERKTKMLDSLQKVRQTGKKKVHIIYLKTLASLNRLADSRHPRMKNHIGVAHPRVGVKSSHL
jgi:hypothetical protein